MVSGTTPQNALFTHIAISLAFNQTSQQQNTEQQNIASMQ